MHWAVLVIIGAVGLVQLPLLADALIMALPQSPLRRWTEAGVAQLLAGTMLLLLAVALAVFYLNYLPELPAATGLYHAVGITYVWLLVVDNYCHAALLRPAVEAVLARRVPGFDHFCPFTLNHVWRDNYVRFYCFLAYASLGAAYATWVSYPRFADSWLSLLWGQRPQLPDPDGAWRSWSLMFVAALSLGQATAFLFLFQTYLLWRGWTTVDFFRALRVPGSMGDTLRLCFSRRAQLPQASAGPVSRRTRSQTADSDGRASVDGAGLGQAESKASTSAAASASSMSSAVDRRGLEVDKWQLLKTEQPLYFVLPPTLLWLLGVKSTSRSDSAQKVD